MQPRMHANNIILYWHTFRGYSRPLAVKKVTIKNLHFAEVFRLMRTDGNYRITETLFKQFDDSHSITKKNL